jgi:hypothetical protein
LDIAEIEIRSNCDLCSFFSFRTHTIVRKRSNQDPFSVTSTKITIDYCMRSHAQDRQDAQRKLRTIGNSQSPTTDSNNFSEGRSRGRRRERNVRCDLQRYNPKLI